MPYKIVFSDSADAQLKRLDRVYATRIARKLRSIAGNPQLALRKLSGREELKLRVGDYRLLIIILHDENMLLIVAIGHRSDVYKKH
ncbi:MAG TPA: type II toxin-antitoxin system RelE/ParE family toxin [Candidatus Baltobacteraceae bacterium]|nr:type II toxin-antitoxin system RelE/ParE family toxin [Candidatus Baltobacteraceae bacterium]